MFESWIDNFYPLPDLKKEIGNRPKREREGERAEREASAMWRSQGAWGLKAPLTAENKIS